MTPKCYGSKFRLIVCLILSCWYNNHYSQETQEIDLKPQNVQNIDIPKQIRAIIIVGNTHTTDSVIHSKIPFKEQTFFFKNKTSLAIKSLYSLGFYQNVELFTVPVSENLIDLKIVLHEKPLVEKWVFVGNKHLSQSEIEKKINLSHIKTITQEDLFAIEQKIKRMYAERDYHYVTITSQLEHLKNGHVIVHIKVVENKTTYIRRVHFAGNKAFASKILNKLLFSREAWLFGFFNKSGSFRAEALEYDKYVLESFYRNHGYITAQVVDVQKIIDPLTKTIDLTFVIDEGDMYAIGSISAPENEEFSEDQIKNRIAIRPGMIYSQDMIKQTIEQLKLFFSEHGYFYADVQPAIHPDKKTHLVELIFHTHLGEKIYIGTVNLRGNTKTRDYVIRRQLACCEGELLTQGRLDASKARVERLGFFDPQDGVNWKMHRFDDHTADLDLLLHERKTGKLFVEGSFGPGAASSESIFKFGAGAYDTNIMGTGLQFNINTRISSLDKELLLSFTNPWIFNRPIHSAATLNYTSVTYDDIFIATSSPVEKLWLGDLSAGFVSEKLRYARVSFGGGFDSLKYCPRPVSALPSQPYVQQYLNCAFKDATFGHLALLIEKDMRNHPAMPNNGYHWALTSRFGIPTCRYGVGFFKQDADLHWYTPLINAYDLILHFHAHAGLVLGYKHNYSIPYRELYHIGGPTTVRGFTYGQIGPNFCNTSLGAKKAGYINIELVFPLKNDMSMRGLVFYDGGTGWDTPCAASFPKDALFNNRFNYRHAVGFGIRMTSPAPISIDWGFKLDRNKRQHEKYGEVHFSMSQAF
ncbi:MAG: Outer membrane protein assembly factor BamA [candidate division TM6 bacterium GW2011_GWE2_41_16]|nr:MAG: Outer membrane protein assembly factor BamA [candidate division TM6 bacterium GW2011_GWE2_41_16]